MPRTLARRFALGRAARLSDGPVARGKQGVVWRLDTADGSWAVKVPFHSSSEDEVRLATAFQEAAYAAGVPTPQVRRTTEGCVFAAMEGRQVRVYEWVDLLAPDSRLDPARVGAVVAAIHRVSVPDLGPLDPWYHEPVGADRWDQLVEQLLEAGAPFAGRLADLRDELVALESWIEPPRDCCGPATATCGPTTSCRPRTAECASSTGRTAVRPIRARSSGACSSSSPAPTRAGPAR